MTERLSNKQQMTGEEAGRGKRRAEWRKLRDAGIKGEGTGKYGRMKVISWLNYTIKHDGLIAILTFTYFAFLLLG